MVLFVRKAFSEMELFIFLPQKHISDNCLGDILHEIDLLPHAIL